MKSFNTIFSASESNFNIVRLKIKGFITFILNGLENPMIKPITLKILFGLLCFLLVSNTTFSQHWMSKFAHLNNFHDIKVATEDYFSADTSRISNKTFGFKDFQRWLYFVEPRIDTDGSLKSYVNDFNLARTNILNEEGGDRIFAQWQPVGPIKNTQPNPDARMGLVTSIWVDQTNFDTIYAGSNSGGLFVSYNGGDNWRCLTDKDMLTGIEAIVKNKKEPNTIYLGTGYYTWGKDYGVGVVKSTDNGNTWISTGLNASTFAGDPLFQNVGFRIGNLVQHPDSTNKLLALVIFEFGRGSKIMRTNDGGFSWETVYEIVGENVKKQLFKIELNALNPSIVMVSGAHVLKSNDFGNSWLNLDSLLVWDSMRISRASASMHPNEPGKILIILEKEHMVKDSIGYDLLLSEDDGSSFHHVDYINQQTWPGIGFYKMELEWSKLNSNVFYIGGKYLTKNTLLDDFKVKFDKGYIHEMHVDVRCLRTFKKRLPNSSYVGWVYQGNDGGLTKGQEINDSVVWTDLSKNGLSITQYYGIGIPNEESDLIIGGTQDGNYGYHSEGIFSLPFAMDAGDVVFDHRNSDNVYMVTFMTTYYGLISRNKGLTWPLSDTTNKIRISDPVRRNDAPIEMSPANPKRIYVGGSEVWKTMDGFETKPVKISDFKGSNDDNIKLKTIREARSNPRVVYAARETPHWNSSDRDKRRLFKTINADSQTPLWTDITPSTQFVPIDYAGISDIAVNPYDADVFYMSMFRFINKKSVFKGSGNSTILWEDISDGLPSVPVNCLKYYRRSPQLNELFAGTDLGVYYRNDIVGKWIPFGIGLPTVIITDIEINYKTKELVVSTFGRGIFKIDLCFDPYIVEDIVITGTETWNDKVITNNVILQTGASLTILGKVQMPPDKNIFINKGALLTLDGGTITNACKNELWGGIIIRGDNAAPQTPNRQGFIVIENNGTIENARIGIHCVNDPPKLAGGGIIVANKAIFRNNIVGVQFETCNRNSISRFTDCTFEIKDKIIGETKAKYLVRLNNIKGIKFLGCNFKAEFNFTIPQKSIIGIFSNNSSFYIDRLCTSPCLFPVQSLFTGLEYGIYAVASQFTPSFLVNNTHFDDCKTGVYASTINNARVQNCIFNIEAINDVTTGLYLDNCSGYIVEDNEFKASTYNSAALRYGIYINHSGEDNNMVYRNKFFKLTYGIATQGRNRNKTGEKGLQIKCNQFNGVKVDMCILAQMPGMNYGIATNQGSDSTYSSPAGNLFSQSEVPDYYGIYNEGEFINYFHHNANSSYRVAPFRWTEPTVNLKETIFNYSDTCCPRRESGGGSSIIDELLYGFNAEAASISQSLDLLVDEGDTDEKIFDINVAAPAEALIIRDNLLHISPYVSDTVIKAAIIREELINNAMLRDIMVANPHSAKSESILQKLDSRMEPMPENLKDQVLEGIFLLSAKELMEARRDINQREYDYGFNRLFSANLTDTLSVPLDTLIGLLMTDGSFNSMVKQAWLRYESGDTLSAINLLHSISSCDTISGKEAVEASEQLAFMQWLNNHQTIDTLCIESLETFMQSSSLNVSSAARSLLVANNLLTYQEPYLLPDLTKSSRVKLPVQNSNKSGGLLKIFPNPAKDFITIEYHLSDKSYSGEFFIVDASGRLLYTKQASRLKDQFVVDVRQYKAGNYLVQLRSDNKIIATAKFIISN